MATDAIPLGASTRDDSADRLLRQRLADSHDRYREYWLTLDPRDQDRLPRP